MRYCIVCFGEVDIDREDGVSMVFMFENVVDDALKSSGCVRVWSKSVLDWGNKVVFKEVGHDLSVYEGVKDFGDYWEERDGSIVRRGGCVAGLIDFYDFCDF